MHTTMVPEQVKTMKIQAGVQVSRPRELRRHLQLWKCFKRYYFIVILLDRNILVTLIINTNLLREALEITPIDQAHQFESPPSGDAIMDFVNELGYPEEIHFVSKMVVNNLYRPWRAILSMINQCLTGKTSGFDRPKYLVLQGIITRTNVDYAELMWEEFVQAIQTFLADKANLGIATKKDKKIKPHVIPYLGNLKFVPKGEEDEVFGMQIPKELITDNIRNARYYNAYLEMSKKPATAKQPKRVSSKQSKPTPAKQPKPVKEKSTKPFPIKKAGKDKVRKVRKGKRSLQLVDEPDEEPQPAPKPQVEDKEYDLQQEGKGKGIATDEQVALSMLDLHKPKKKIRDTPSPTDAETGADTDKKNSEGDTGILNTGEEQGEDLSNKVDLKEKTAKIDEGQAR
ncbi:hypothetical protein Tco_1419538 [Tanacetum coccineum]